MKKMTCDECGKPASVYWKETVNGKTKEAHLCAECAEKKDFGKFFHETNFFEDFFPAFPIFGRALASGREALRCPTCGETAEEVRESGSFGCPDCYRTFRDRLDLRPFIGRGYRGGRLTAAAAKPEKKEDPEARIQSLRKQLKEAVSKENYEEAARLRDVIRGLEA